jgi:hypothetical protein
MLFRMAFKTTGDNYLQVTAFAKGRLNLTAVHLNNDVFSIALKIAEIPEPTSSKLEPLQKRPTFTTVSICAVNWSNWIGGN